MMKCECCNRNNLSGLICTGCLNRTLNDVRRNQQSVKSEIYTKRQSSSVRGFVDAVERSGQAYDAARLQRRLHALNERIRKASSTNDQIRSQIRNRRNDIITRRYNLTASDEAASTSQSEQTRRSSSLTYLELKESRRVLASECLNIYGLQGLSNGTTEVAGVLVPPLNRLQCLSHLHLLYIASILTQILHHLSNYLTLPLPFTTINAFTFKPSIGLSDTNKVLLGGVSPFKTNKHTLPSLQALSMLVYNLSFLLHVVGFPVEHANIAFVLNMLSRLEDSPHLGAKSFGASCVTPLINFSTLKIPLSVIMDTLSNDSTLHQSSSSNEDSEDQWEVVE